MLTKAAAFALVETDLRARYDRPDGTTVQINTATIIELPCGWVMEFNVIFPDPTNLFIGATRVFIDTRDESLHTFAPFPAVWIQGAVYQATHPHHPPLPWPVASRVTRDAQEHLTLNLAPDETLCGLTAPLSLLRTLGTLDIRTVRSCFGCSLALGKLGDWCFHCGAFLHPKFDRGPWEEHHGPLPPRELPPIPPEERLFSD